MDDFKIKFINDIAIVKVDILAATGRDAKPLWDELDSKSILDWDKIIIDLSYCTFVDSTFIGMIVKIYKNVSEKNGKIKLVVPSLHERDSFRMIGIRSVMECFDILDEAVDSYDTKIPTRKVAFEIRNPEY